MILDLSPYHPALEAMLRANAAVLGLPEPFGPIHSELLGRGESNLSFRLSVGHEHSFTLRLCHRPEVAQNLEREFALLHTLPQGFGPRPYLLETSAEILPGPFALVSYLPGEVLTRLTLEQLRAHGRRLAELHNATESHAEGAAAPDIHQEFLSSLAYWRGSHPALLEQPEVKRLISALERHFERVSAPLLGSARAVIIHGDPCLPNILFDGAQVNYIDWEWTRLGDPAQDLSQVGWHFENLPWQTRLSEFEEATYLNAYQEVRPDPTLLERRRLWVALYGFFDHLHFRTKAAAQAAQEEVRPGELDYAGVVARMYDALSLEFLPARAGVRVQAAPLESGRKLGSYPIPFSNDLLEDTEAEILAPFIEDV